MASGKEKAFHQEYCLLKEINALIRTYPSAPDHFHVSLLFSESSSNYYMFKIQYLFIYIRNNILILQ